MSGSMRYAKIDNYHNKRYYTCSDVYCREGFVPVIISWKENDKPIQTDKAIGFKINHNGAQKIMWIPKSQIKNKLKHESKMADIPDWLYDKKIDELFP